jgi:hypothetical protein
MRIDNSSASRVAFSAMLFFAVTAMPVLAQKISIESDDAGDFTRYKTFAIQGGQLTSKDPALNSDLTKKRIEESIEKYLAAKGLTKKIGKADLNVRYHLGSARKREVERYPAGWRGWGTRVVRVPYSEGTLVIDLRDTSTHSLVWRSIASEEKSNGTQIEGKLDNMVKKSFEKYPPKK